jgi:alpha-L-fucosidase
MRDLVGDLGTAVRAKGMKYAPSYHRERHTGFFAMDLCKIKSPPRPDIAEEIKRHPEAADLYGPFEYSDAFIADYTARWKELERKYKPDFMWVDDVPIFYKAEPHKQWRKICQKAGLSDLKFHDLRKTFGSLLAQNGISTAVTQKLLEHTSPRLTNKVYTNVDPVLRQSVNQLPIEQWLGQ